MPIVITGQRFPYYKVILEDNPYGYWRLGESPGASTAVDTSGNNRNGTYQNSPTLGASGLINNGTAMTTDAAGEKVDSIDGSGWDGTTDFTVEFWCQYTDTSRQMLVWDKSIGDNNFRMFVAVNRDNTGSLNAGHVCINTRQTSSNNISGDGNLDDGNPHHVVCGRSGSSAFIYVDNVSLSLTGSVNTGDVHNGANFKIATIGDVSQESTFFYNGTIDEVAFYTSALSPTRIQAHYNAGK